MVEVSDEETRHITYFNFKTPETRERLELWLIHTRSMIKMNIPLSEKDLGKISELCSILIKDGEYKIPRGVGKRKSPLTRDEKLVCWYRVTLETKLEMKATEAKKATAERFLISQKQVEALCTRHRKGIERMIDKFGYDEVSYPYIYHLNLYKKGKEGLLKKFLAKYPI